MRRWAAVIAVATAALAVSPGCSSDKEGSGTEDAVEVTPAECFLDGDCPSGKCIDGQCVSLPGWDAGTDDTTGGPDTLAQDIVVGSDAEDAPGDVPPEPEVVQQQDGSGKPQGGQPDIMVDPLSYMFTYVPGVNNPEIKAVTIYNEGTGTLLINEIKWATGSSSEFTFMALPPLPAQLGAFQQTAVTVVFKEKSPHGPGKLLIASNDLDEPEVLVEFTSQSKVGDQPCIGLSPTILNFGQVVRGETKALPFTLSNCSGTLPLKVSKITRSKGFFGMELTDEFQIVPAPATPMVLSANQTVDYEVTYTPGLAGADSGDFEFHNNDPTASIAKLHVQGVGVPPPLEDIGIHIELDWDKDSCDVDLHLVRPGGTLFDCESDCYYANMNPDWGVQGSYLDDPFLDYDDVDGYGPENTNLSEPIPGTYLVTMHYYNDSYEGWSGGATNATVRVYSYGNLIGTFGPTLLQNTDKTWDVCKIQWPGAGITELGNIYEAPTQPACFPW